MATTTATGHRRLLEHLADPACPSIRRFVQEFPLHAAEEIGKEQRACSSLPGGNGSRGASDHRYAEDDTYTSTTENTLRDGAVLRNGETSRNGSVATANGSTGTGDACCSGGDSGGDRADGGRIDLKGGDGSGGAPTATALREAYNECLGALGDFRWEGEIDAEWGWTILFLDLLFCWLRLR